MRSQINPLKKICHHADFKTKKIVANVIIQSKLQYMLPLFGDAPEYLLRGLQVQPMAAARAVIGNKRHIWSIIRTLNYLGWLNIKQQYVSSTLMLPHKILTSRRLENINRSMATPYPRATRRATKQQHRSEGEIHLFQKMCFLILGHVLALY